MRSYPHTRRSRAKSCDGWERLEAERNGIFVHRVAKIALRYPSLTTTQLRVAALATELLTSHEIARILGSTERAVEKVRSRIRKTIALPPGAPLAGFLVSLLDQENKDQHALAQKEL